MNALTVLEIREAVKKVRRAQDLKKTVKFYKVAIKNFELFEKLKKAGKIKQTRPGGPWELV